MFILLMVVMMMMGGVTFFVLRSEQRATQYDRWPFSSNSDVKFYAMVMDFFFGFGSKSATDCYANVTTDYSSTKVFFKQGLVPKIIPPSCW